MIDVIAALSLKNEVEEQGAQLVAVSKTKPISMIQDLYDQGFRIFGENKVQELVEKHEQMPKDIEWHMIGNLQTNKVKYIAPFVSLIHSVSSKKLLGVINKEAEKAGRLIPILLQAKISQEDTKSGMPETKIKELVHAISNNEYPHVDLKGLMGMASFTDDMTQVKQEFAYLKQLSDEIISTPCDMMAADWTISMGMSGDYNLAIEEGSTMVRIGSLLFGARNYN